MLTITVSVDGVIRRAANNLSSLADRAEQVERESLKEGGELVRTKVRRSLKEQMNTKGAAVITQNTSGALASSHEYVIRGSGKGLPIKEFPVKGGRKTDRSWRDQPRDGHGRFGELPDNEGGRVVGQPWAVAHRFKRSFVNMAGEFVATLPGTRRTRRLYGPSIAKEIVKDQTAATFESQAAQTVEGILLKRIGRIL